jgi:hypothetical protein
MGSAEAGMRRIPKEEHAALRQTARHPHQVPFLPLTSVEQFLNSCLKTPFRVRGHQLGIVTTVGRLAFAAADLE